MFSISFYPILFAIFITIFSTFLSSVDGAATARRHQKGLKKAVDHPNGNSAEYDYHAGDDYSNGIFIDAVPTAEKSADGAKKAPTTEAAKGYKRTNRYPTRKLRRFFDGSKARREWYEALFGSISSMERR